MGYTHYWRQLRNLTREEWSEISTDLAEIFKHAQHAAGIPLANGMGDGGSSPEITNTLIAFNGVDDDAYETFSITRARQPKEPWQRKADGDFCKTARNPYDSVVTASLCYLSTCLEKPAFTVSSDGKGRDFLTGLQLARDALPRKANELDIPRGVMESDRWTGPWVLTYTPGDGGSGANTGYGVMFCVDGKGYVIPTRGHDRQAYCFPSHVALAEFLTAHRSASFDRNGAVIDQPAAHWRTHGHEPTIWNATGSFDPKRHARLAKAQRRVLSRLFPVPADNAQNPPLYVRPNEFPDPIETGSFCYYLDDLLAQRVA